jgi:flagellar biosynthesis/type III secretory pathway protein FliH
MQTFVLDKWEEIGERINQDSFVPLQIEIYSKSEKTEGLLSEAFEETIQYASGPRAHTSIEATREEQSRKRQNEKEISEQIILTQAQIDKMVTDSFNKGREEALAEAITSNNERFTQMEQHLGELLKDLAEQEKTSIEELEQEALNFSLEIGRKVIEHAVEINPEYILKILREALKLSGGARVKKIRVSPQDMEFIEVLKVAQTIKEFDGTWVFESDETIKAGCILESNAGTIDFQLDKAWERIKDKVMSVRKE